MTIYNNLMSTHNAIAYRESMHIADQILSSIAIERINVLCLQSEYIPHQPSDDDSEETFDMEEMNRKVYQWLNRIKSDLVNSPVHQLILYKNLAIYLCEEHFFEESVECMKCIRSLALPDKAQQLKRLTQTLVSIAQIRWNAKEELLELLRRAGA